ncbi:MAG: hypothetical protein ACT4N4_10310 [Rhodospirillales bacterium]
MPWLWKFAAISLGTIACVAGAVVAILWFLTGSGPGELGLHGTIALILGVSLSAALGVGLMALVFLSARGGRDDIGGPRR